MPKDAEQDWTQAFHFTEDLQALETLYQAEHQEAIKQQIYQPAKADMPGSKDERFLTMLSEKIAQRLGHYLDSQETFSEYLHLQDLEKDNAIMAEQLRLLHQQVVDLQGENARLYDELTQYRPIWGALHFKLKS